MLLTTVPTSKDVSPADDAGSFLSVCRTAAFVPRTNLPMPIQVGDSSLLTTGMPTRVMKSELVFIISTAYQADGELRKVRVESVGRSRRLTPHVSRAHIPPTPTEAASDVDTRFMAKRLPPKCQ